MFTKQEREENLVSSEGNFKGVKYCIWDVDLTFYRVTQEMADGLKDRIYEYISQGKEITLGEAKKDYEREFERTKSKTAAMVALGFSKYAIQEVIDSIDKQKYIKKDPRLIQLFNTLDNYKHAIVSNSTRVSVNETLKRLGLEKDLFKTIITKDEVSEYKPSPAPFLRVMEKLGARPEECVSIGDVENSDIIPAKKLGMKTIFVWGSLEEADASVPTVYDIEKLLT
jgi:HAD superfamily hydrolase (TIGR01549 family)